MCNTYNIFNEMLDVGNKYRLKNIDVITSNMTTEQNSFKFQQHHKYFDIFILYNI